MNLDELNKIPILEVADKLSIKIIRKGFANCFGGHDKRTPSLSFSEKKNLWYCFACSKGGTNIQLVMQALNIGFKDALNWFNSNYSINSKSNQYQPYNKLQSPTPPSYNREILEEIFYTPNQTIYAFLVSKLSLSNMALKFLKSRGYTLETINRLNLKDITNSDNILKQLKINFPLEDLEKCGLIKYDEISKKYKFIWWCNALIIPFCDQTGQIIYLQGRSINTEAKWKYLNLYGLPKPIYNLNHLNNVSKGAMIYLFEGVTDCIMGIQAGFNSFGILGASGFKEQWTSYFENYIINVVPDNDQAGEMFAVKISDHFLKIGKRVNIRRIPFGKDFSEFSLTQKKS